MGKVRAFFHTANRRHWLGILTMLAVSVFSVNTMGTGHNLMSSVTSTVKQDPFDGTVMPIQKVPDWSNLSSGQSGLSYSELPTSKLISIPEYDNDVLMEDTADLGWSDSDKEIRNAQITYPVPYAGNYELDNCGEGCGSHPAVDIKTLLGTPVYAIANGVIEEAGTSSSWGNYVVIRHSDVPDPDSSKRTTTLFSIYAHLDQLFVSEGKAISKAAILGEVGDTGTATTYHLHFQIDNANAPWHPYWPFTTADASAAGYDFWDAVSEGVGKDNVYAYTENPLDYVQKYLDEDAEFDNDVQTDDDEEDTSSDDDDSSQDSGDDDDDEPVQTTTTEVSGEDFASIEIQIPEVVQVGEQETLHVLLLDKDGDTVEDDASFAGKITLTVSDSSVGSLNRSSLDKYNFDEGDATLRFYGEHTGTVSLTATFDGETFTSELFDVVSEIGDYDHLEIDHDGVFVPGKAETIQIKTVDEDGNPVSSFTKYGTINLSVFQGEGKLSPDHVRNDDFKHGIAEVSFTGSSDDPVILKYSFGLDEGFSEPLASQLFNDLDEDNSSYPAVSYLYKKGTVQGYPDGTFQPDKTVSRVESLKFIFAGLDQPVSTKLKVSFKDTQSGLWYSNYLATASSKGVVQGYSDGTFKPTQGVNKVEFLKMLFSTVEDVEVDPVVSEDPYDDVDTLAWYAPYVAYSKEKNIFPVSGSDFNPSEPMSRLEVAEVIYRFITVLDNDEEPYSSLKKPSDS